MPYLLSKVNFIALLRLGRVIVHSHTVLIGYDTGQSGDWKLPLSPVRISPQLGTGVAGGCGKSNGHAISLLFKHPLSATLTVIGTVGIIIRLFSYAN